MSDAPAEPDDAIDRGTARRTADGIAGGAGPVPHEMYAADRVAHEMGMHIVESAPGHAVVTMTVGEEMSNGLGVCHGGLLFTLADTAMAYASNSGDHRAFSTSASIEWVRSARPGDRLRATCRTVVTRGRSSIHDIVVVDGDGETVALVRGHTLAVADRTT